MAHKYGYELDYGWDHPWPRAPIPVNEIERLEELRRYQVLDTPQEERYNKLCRIACKEMKCPIAAVSFIDKQRQWFKANSGLTQAAIPRDVALCAHTIMNPRTAVVVGDTTLDERFKNNPLVTRASSVKFYAGVPLVTSRGFCIGSVFVFDVKTHASCDTKLLQKIAAKVMKYLDEKLQASNDVPVATPNPNVASAAPTSRPVVAPPVATAKLPAAAKEQPQPEPQPKAQTPIKTVSPAPNGVRSSNIGAPAVVMVPPAPVPAPEPQAQADSPTPSDDNALVPSTPGQSQERSLSTAVNNDGQMTNMGAMLMNLLARTTETQQQLAAQQGVMFETLGHHSEQLTSLSETLSHLEMRIDKTVKPTKR